MFHRVKLYLDVMRPTHWVKNLFVIAPLLLARQFTFVKMEQIAEAFLVFCAAASSIYVWNDIMDRRRDQEHETKRMRPITNGSIGLCSAITFGAVLSAVALGFAWQIDRVFFVVMAGYYLLNFLYSTVLKHVVIIDLFAIAANYVLRILGGTFVIHETVTPWTIILGTLLALFLALGKRRSERVLLQERASAHRATLGEYTPYLLDQLTSVITPSIAMAWILYTVDPDISARLHTKWLPITTPFVLYGIFRYLYLMHRRGKGESPTHTLLTDSPLLLTVGLWCASIVAIRFI